MVEWHHGLTGHEFKELWDMVKDRRAWCVAVHGGHKNRTLVSLDQQQYSLYMCVYHYCFIQSPVNEHLGCFHVLVIVNSAAVNVGVHVSFDGFNS